MAQGQLKFSRVTATNHNFLNWVKDINGVESMN